MGIHGYLFTITAPESGHFTALKDECALNYEGKDRKKIGVKARCLFSWLSKWKISLPLTRYDDAQSMFMAILSSLWRNLFIFSWDLNVKFIVEAYIQWDTLVTYAFFLQPNGSQIVHEDLEQFHDDEFRKMGSTSGIWHCWHEGKEVYHKNKWKDNKRWKGVNNSKENIAWTLYITITILLLKHSLLMLTNKIGGVDDAGEVEVTPEVERKYYCYLGQSVNTSRPVSMLEQFQLMKKDLWIVDAQGMLRTIASPLRFKEFDGGYRLHFVGGDNMVGRSLVKGFKPAIGFMKPFGCHVTILNTLDKLGKFDGKSDDGFFVGYSLSSKAFRVYNIRTRIVQENLHVGFLENKPMVEGNGPKWLFDLDSLTQSMNYVPVVAGTFSNVSAGIKGGSESSISSQQDQDCIFMPIWKDASYFEDDSLKSVDDAQLQDQDGTHDDCSFQDDGIDDHQVNTASPQVNTGSRVISTAAPEVNTATSEGVMEQIPTTEDIQVEDQDIELGNISPSYEVSSTPHTRIHKDHPIDHVIGDVQSSVQTRRMTTSYSELGFLSAIYEGKTHQDLHTCLFACFLSQEEPKRVSKALSDPAWVEAMQEELLQFKLQNVWVLVDLHPYLILPQLLPSTPLPPPTLSPYLSLHSPLSSYQSSSPMGHKAIGIQSGIQRNKKR
ncbi:putative ribonuclease H-like domain-containing protein [Tanacetum coccineum]